MALHFPLYVNETQIGYFYALRLEGAMEPDSLNRYKIKIWTDRPILEDEPPQWEFEMNHRYGDGAWELIRKALIKARALSSTKKALNEAILKVVKDGP